MQQAALSTLVTESASLCSYFRLRLASVLAAVSGTHPALLQNRAGGAEAGALPGLHQPLNPDPYSVPVTPSEMPSPHPSVGGLSRFSQHCHHSVCCLAASLATSAWVRPGNGTRTHLALAGSWLCFALTFCGSIHHSRASFGF